jgi:hypothetical protein
MGYMETNSWGKKMRHLLARIAAEINTSLIVVVANGVKPDPHLDKGVWYVP